VSLAAGARSIGQQRHTRCARRRIVGLLSIAVLDGVSRLTCLGHQTISSKLHVTPIGRRGLPIRKRGYVEGVCRAPAIKEIFVSKPVAELGSKASGFRSSGRER
jgi:hypothetical protein